MKTALAGSPAAASPKSASETGSKDGATQRAYAALRAMAMTFGLPPGQRLNEGALAHGLRVSRTPLREALHRLASEGLVVAVPGQGFRARLLDVKEVSDLCEVRLALETTIVERACERATDASLDAIDAYLDASVEVGENAPIERLVRLDEGFHERLAELTGNAELTRMLRGVNDRIHFFRWTDMRGRRDRTQGEHRAIAASIRARDVKRARATLRRHVTRRSNQIIDVIREGYARLCMGEGPRADDLQATQGGEAR